MVRLYGAFGNPSLSIRAIPLRNARRAGYIARMHHRLVKPSFAVVVSWLLLLQACGGSGPSEQQLLASAKTYLAANDIPAAIIQLKNALQKSPDSGEAR